MSDVLKFIVDPEAQISDPDGLLMELPEWSEDIATKLAADEGVELTDEHWGVIKFLRQYYARGGDFEHARELTEALTKQVSDKGGRRYLYQLFPHGPVTQGCKIAGLPVPRDSTDPGFGYAQ